MPSSPCPSAYSSPAAAPWQLPRKSAPLGPSIQSYGQEARYTRYTPSPSTSTSPSPPSSPSRGSLTTGGATYSVPPSYSTSSSSSSRRAGGRGSRTHSTTAYSSIGLGISSPHSTGGVGDDDVLSYMSSHLAPTANEQEDEEEEEEPSADILRAKQLELAALTSLAQTRLSSARLNFADGIRAARECRTDLEWTGQHVRTLNERARRRWPREFSEVDGRVERVVDEEC